MSRSRSGAFALLLLLGAASSPAIPPAPGATPATAALLVKVAAAVEGGLRKGDEALARVAGALARSGLDSGTARQLLDRLCGRFAYAVACSAGAEPGATRLGEASPSAEGYGVVALQRPVTAVDGATVGTATLLLRPDRLIAEAVAPRLRGTAATVTVLQRDGRLLYGDPVAGGEALLARILAVPHGSAQGDEGETAWVTVSLHGTAWRVVLQRQRESTDVTDEQR